MLFRSTKKIMSNYEKLPIKDRDELNITVEEICKLLGKAPDSFLKEIFEDIEKKVLMGKIPNKKEELKKYISNKY